MNRSSSRPSTHKLKQSKLTSAKSKKSRLSTQPRRCLRTTSSHKSPLPTKLQSKPHNRGSRQLATFPSSTSPPTPFSLRKATYTTSNPDFRPDGTPVHRATTILCVRKGNQCVMIGDGQVSLGPTVVKPNAKKIRRIGHNNSVITGFAGSTADAFTLLGLLETQLEHHPGQLLRAAVETAKLWRTDKMSRHLEAMVIASDASISLCISGNGDVIESHDGLLGIGSGSIYALSAGRALIDIDGFDAMQIAKKAMNIAADICVYTNHNFIIDTLDITPPANTTLPGGTESPLSTDLVSPKM